MKFLIENSFKYFGALFLTTMLIIGSGCTTPKPMPDPLAGWTFRQFDDFAQPSGRHHYQLNKAVEDDCKTFISTNHLNTLGAITGYFEDGKGQTAVEFEAFPPNQNASWHYVLIYDKKNIRIKMVKYGYHKFES